jgi:tRNA modification GTPase
VFATDDTIVAIATPVGRAGLGVVRVSGPAARDVAGQLIARKKPLAPRHATLATVLDLTEPSAATTEITARPTSSLDSVVVTFFPGPGSYTGQDTVEISAHGSPVVLERIVASAVRAGARMAQPGEFTLRAYVNGRLFDQLSGTLTGAIRDIGDRLYALIVRLEASLDFPDEGYHFVETSELASELEGVHRDIQSLLAGARRGRVIREGRQVVLVGGPNVGKSSLFNAIVGAERAIVTPVAGTTRDLVTERCEIEGSPITLVDTAGLREGAELVELEGIRRARGAASVAAVALVVLDRSRPLEETVHAIRETAGLSSRIIVANKADLVAAWEASELNEACVAVSAVTGGGLGSLRRALVGALSGEEDTTEAPRVSNVRHIGLLEGADVCVCRAMAQARARAPEELLLADIHEARAALDEVVGRRTSDDVLASIFAEFCIGK